LSPLTVSTKLAWIAEESRRKDLHSDGQQQSCRLWSDKPQVLGPKGPLLTNRMTYVVMGVMWCRGSESRYSLGLPQLQHHIIFLHQRTLRNPISPF
jgi:hypothetical protein